MADSAAVLRQLSSEEDAARVVFEKSASGLRALSGNITLFRHNKSLLPAGVQATIIQRTKDAHTCPLGANCPVKAWDGTDAPSV